MRHTILMLQWILVFRQPNNIERLSDKTFDQII